MTYTSIHCTTLQNITLHCNTLHYTALHCYTLHCTTLQYITLHCYTLHCTTLQYITLHCNTLRYITLHCYPLHCYTLHCNTLHLSSKHAYWKKIFFNHLLPFLLGALTKLRKATVSFIMSVRQSAWNKSSPTGRIFMKFYIWGFLKIWKNSSFITVLQEWRLFSMKT